MEDLQASVASVSAAVPLARAARWSNSPRDAPPRKRDPGQERVTDPFGPGTLTSDVRTSPRQLKVRTAKWQAQRNGTHSAMARVCR